jgi:hypothetical protein
VEVQLLFSFLDWRSKLALARCNRTLRGDCDSPMAWQDSDGPSAFSPAGIIELNLARLTDEQTVARAAARSLAARRGRVRLLYHHCLSDKKRCVLGGCSLPFELFRRTAAALPRLHGIGPLCDGRGFMEEEWICFFTVAMELQRPLSELRVTTMDPFHAFPSVSLAMVSRVLAAALSPVHAPHLRVLTIPWTWTPLDLSRGEKDALAQLPQLTQLECGTQLWLELTEAQPYGALFGQLHSLSLLCSWTRLDALRASLCRDALQHLHVLRLFGSLHAEVNEEDDKRHWSAILAALPRLETLALFLDEGKHMDETLTRLFSAAAPVHPSLRTLQLRLLADAEFNASRAAVEQTLARWPELYLELHLGEAERSWRAGRERARMQQLWNGLPRTRFSDG